MSFERYKTILKTCGLYYLIGATWILGTKYFYSQAGSDDLLWILTPTAWWVRVLGRLPFEYQPDLGYVNHALRFVIAASCSGVQFMMIQGAMLLFSFVHRMKTYVGRVGWLLLSLSASYVITILVNGLRILLAIYLPPWFTEARLWNKYMTPERLHSMIGVVVYFSALLVVYGVVNKLFVAADRQISDSKKDADFSPPMPHSFIPSIIKYASPLFWYLFIVLGIPFLNGASHENRQGFWEYTLLIVAVCGAVTVVFETVRKLRKN